MEKLYFFFFSLKLHTYFNLMTLSWITKREQHDKFV